MGVAVRVVEQVGRQEDLIKRPLWQGAQVRLDRILQPCTQRRLAADEATDRTHEDVVRYASQPRGVARPEPLLTKSFLLGVAHMINFVVRVFRGVGGSGSSSSSGWSTTASS